MRQLAVLRSADAEVVGSSMDGLLPYTLPNNLRRQLVHLLKDYRPIFRRLRDYQQVITDPETGNEVWQLKPPKQYHGYLFGALIGEGSYAKEAIYKKTLQRAAVKIFKEQRLRKIPNGFEHVQTEREILSRLNHRNCIQMYQFFRIEEKEKMYMVLEYCVASLQEVVENFDNGRLPENWAQFFFRQLITGLEYLHSKGNDDVCTAARGTPKFQPPEVVSGLNAVFNGYPIDIWSAGVTLYNLVTGAYPFEGELIMRLFENIAEQPYLQPTIELSSELKT
ncbi:unnamed protein product, partial [Mesorhabditis spiculigera]